MVMSNVNGKIQYYKDVRSNATLITSYIYALGIWFINSKPFGTMDTWR